MCSKCHQNKQSSEYYVKNSATKLLHAQCKECYKSHRRTYYSQHYTKYGDEYRARARVNRLKTREFLHEKILEYLKGKSCSICGQTDIRTFEFDHINPESKSFGIANGIRYGRKWDTILDEIAKCRVLCANCHKIHTANQRSWYKNIEQ